MNIEQALAKWLEYNNRIKQIQNDSEQIYSDLRKLRYKKQIIESKLQKVIPSNNGKTYIFENTRLKPEIVQLSTPISKAYVEEKIKEFFGKNQKDAERLVKMIYDNRPKKDKCSIKCSTIKSVNK